MPDTQHATRNAQRPASPASGLPSPFPAWVKTAGVLAPAGAVTPERLDAGCRQLEEWRLRVVEGEGETRQTLPRLQSTPHRFFSAPDAARLEALHALLRNPQADVLLPLRGGYGCARLLDGLDRDLVRRANKPLVGYSDITALHLAFFACGVRNGLSGPMPGVEFARDLPDTPGARDGLAFTVRSFAEAWTPRASVSLPPGTRLEVLRAGRAQAPVIPVNLTVLLTLAGTRHMPDLTGTILVVEDVNEPAHAVDRDLNHLRQLGVLERLAGLIFGRFSKAEDAQWLPEIFAEYAGFVDGPVVGGFPYGHELPLVTVPVGRTATLEAAPDGTVSVAW